MKTENIYNKYYNNTENNIKMVWICASMIKIWQLYFYNDLMFSLTEH